MDLSIIIVCYKGWEKLTKCLASLNSFSGKSFISEVIVVDNNSADARLDEIEMKFLAIRFVRNSINGGFAYGCNTGASHASGEYLLFLNPDTVAKEPDIERLLNSIRSAPDYLIVSCRQVKEDGSESRATGSFPGLLKGMRKKNPAGDLTNVTFPDWVSGSVMMMRKPTFEMLKGFDEDFWMYSEDVDLCRRTRNSGGEIAFFRDITIEHNHGGSSRASIITTSIAKTEVQISRHLYIHKHKKGTERFGMHALIILDNLITGIITGLTGLIFFFVPKLFVRFLLFGRIAVYYLDSIFWRTWMSRRSVNYRKVVRE